MRSRAVPPRSAKAAGKLAPTCEACPRLVPPLLTYFAGKRHSGFTLPMLAGGAGGLLSFAITLFFSREAKRREMGPIRRSCRWRKCPDATL